MARRPSPATMGAPKQSNLWIESLLDIIKYHFVAVSITVEDGMQKITVDHRAAMGASVRDARGTCTPARRQEGDAADSDEHPNKRSGRMARALGGALAGGILAISLSGCEAQIYGKPNSPNVYYSQRAFQALQMETYVLAGKTGVSNAVSFQQAMIVENTPVRQMEAYAVDQLKGITPPSLSRLENESESSTYRYSMFWGIYYSWSFSNNDLNKNTTFLRNTSGPKIANYYYVSSLYYRLSDSASNPPSYVCRNVAAMPLSSPYYFEGAVVSLRYSGQFAMAVALDAEKIANDRVGLRPQMTKNQVILANMPYVYSFIQGSDAIYKLYYQADLGGDQAFRVGKAFNDALVSVCRDAQTKSPAELSAMMQKANPSNHLEWWIQTYGWYIIPGVFCLLLLSLVIQLPLTYKANKEREAEINRRLGEREAEINRRLGEEARARREAYERLTPEEKAKWDAKKRISEKMERLRQEEEARAKQEREKKWEPPPPYGTRDNAY